MDVVPADDHRYKFADNKWYVKYNTRKTNSEGLFFAERNVSLISCARHFTRMGVIVLGVAATALSLEFTPTGNFILLS